MLFVMTLEHYVSSICLADFGPTFEGGLLSVTTSYSPLSILQPVDAGPLWGLVLGVI